ncbi:hypothetical protein SAMN06265337_1927 [Hymenobacter gelipurpurascens]|uniref:Uncharacterized protein n=1 Tax=Hymenobacter gelipurpurascens TaxID=89968 RepID=A0A212TMT8_9BACT|nr:hypothetical protein [Hymenobacter gelipurpurascens]SNC67369.1 hypothetical protein SAMN06265337_1927 [Hymenobacter gelipurpurascens]
MKRLLLCLLLLSTPVLAHAQPSQAQQTINAKGLIDWLTARLWFRETHGNNRSPAIDALTKAGGGQLGWPWCGYTQLANQQANKLPFPKEAGAARAWFVDKLRTYFLVGQRGALDSLRPGHLVGLSYGNGINHVTRAVEIFPRLRKGRPPRGAWCIGGNEGRGTTAGIHRTYYAGPAIRAASNYNY